MHLSTARISVEKSPVGQPRSVSHLLHFGILKYRDRRATVQLASDRSVVEGLVTCGVGDALAVWKEVKASSNRGFLPHFIEFARLLPVGSHQPDFTISGD